MDFSFEYEMVPVRTLALPKLLENYLRVRNNDPFKNPLDKRDENATKTAFALLYEFFVAQNIVPDTSHIDRESLEKFQIFLVQKVGRRGQLFSRTYCNKLVGYIKTVFFWAMSQKPPIITESRAFALSRVTALKPSPKIRENVRRKNVAAEHVENLLPLLRPVVADMLRLQMIHGMRSGEICSIKASEIDFNFDGTNWLYQPMQHKTATSGHERNFVFCRKSQEIVNPYINAGNEWLFLNEKRNPFTVDVYNKVIRETIEKHNLKKFTPYQLRHAAATETKQKFGIGYAKELLGHADEKMTKQYCHDSVEMLQELANARNAVAGNAIAVGAETCELSPVILRIYREGGEV